MDPCQDCGGLYDHHLWCPVRRQNEHRASTNQAVDRAVQVEREACASIADALGAPEVARKIRERKQDLDE